MNHNKIKNAAIATLTAAILLFVSSCVKDKFSVPSPGADINPPGLAATITIAQFKQLYAVPNIASPLPVALPDSDVLTGIVNADDKSGNFYKALTFQDSTGGLQIRVADSYLWQRYPIGRRVFIKTKGLYIFNNEGTIQLGGYIDLSGTYPEVGEIPSSQEPNVIIGGQWGLTVPVTKTTLAALNNVGNYITMQSMLYEIDSVEFSASDTTATYANNLSKASVSIPINDCFGYSMDLYTSGYANFAGSKVSSGHGNILGIYEYYSNGSGAFELEIRDSTDIRFTSTQRCQ